MTGGAVSGGFDYREAGPEAATSSVALSHLSVELGHLFPEDLAEGTLTGHFAVVAPWVQATAALARRRATKARISTCLLIVDHADGSGSPRDVIPRIQAAAKHSGLAVDYVARESALTDGPAREVFDRIVPEPHPGTTGTRPPLDRSGWLCNGQRSPTAGAAPAMTGSAWQPPAQTGARQSIFVDVELRDSDGGGWSVTLLRAVWQLLRLGLLRPEDARLTAPEPAGTLPESWAELPPVVRLTERPAPLCAYQNFSVLPTRFLEVEVAAGLVLSMVRLTPGIDDQVIMRARREGIRLPAAPQDRVDRAFLTTDLR
ncbi:hypothetical protein GCM10010168_90540 [Actinoplanes ianthinogenes]|uniref:Uncharacterized protein n=1 Tax=Actinoplanes ianthinogenes TaxID=122358 RepID=A0ABM7LSL9_9ACTN|nr:SCO2522 family protein [Actinoplanes ianthinogenes]BCJ42329.1 hypothetical protein Aiant_29860 [Actinoplanes ianthinogenes]GGR57574.1 hypothetical protein GCM10010168_90540 [Actinoplanes ianthinogenes]